MPTAFPVGSAPWETASAPQAPAPAAPAAFAVGQAPWEQSQPAPAAAPKQDFLSKAAGIADAIFPGTKAIGASIANAGAAIGDLATGGVKKFMANAPSNATNIPQLAGAYAGNAGEIATAALPGVGAGAKLAVRTAAGAGQGYASDVSTNLAEGKANPLMPGFGTAVGAVLPGTGAAASAAKNTAVKFADDAAPRVINSLIKPLAKDFSYGKNPGRAVAALGITANNFDDLASKINQARQSTGQQIGALGAQLSKQPDISVVSSLDHLNDAMRTAATQNNASLLNRLQAVKQSITHVLEPATDEAGNVSIQAMGQRNLDKLDFQGARDVLRNIGDMTQFTGNPSDDKIVNGALKQVYGSIKGATLDAADKADPALAGQFRKLTEQYADLTSAKVATEYRDKIAQRSNLIGLKPLEAGIGAGIITAVATGGASLPAIGVGVAASTIDKLAGSTMFKTHLAAVLSKKTPQEVKAAYSAMPALQKILPLGAARLNQ